MRPAFLLATLAFLIAPIAGVAQTGQPATPPGQAVPPAGPPGTAPSAQPATPPPPQSPSPNAPPPPTATRPETLIPAAPAGDAPTVPAGETPTEAAQPVPDSGGTLSRVNVQGNRRVETDAIRAVVALRAGDKYDRPSLRQTVLAVWRMGYFNDVKVDVSRDRPPGQGYVLTLLVNEKPAIHEIKLEG